MNTIPITIAEENELVLKLKSDYANKAIGTQYDSGALRLEFTRPEGTESYEMVLMLNYGSGKGEENIGEENAFTLSRPYTEGDELSLQVAFYEGDTFRRGTGKVKFLFVSSSIGGSVPTGNPTADWSGLLSSAFASAELINDEYQFKNTTGEVVATLEASVGAIAELDILGAYDTLADLQSAHATASEGDAYLVDTILYVWTDGAWVNGGTIKGADGTNGTDGKSAYEIAVDSGFEGTEAEWGESLKGADGKDGEGSEAVNLPTMRITATTEDLAVMTKDNAIQVSYVYTDRDRTKEGFATLQWQGTSSTAYDKKNFNFKTYTDDTYSEKEKVQWKSTWLVTNRINLKANWIDATQARNVVNGKLVASMIASNPQKPDELYSTPNLGQVDGYPILVYINDECQGVYTLNLGKKEEILGCSDVDKHIIFEGASGSDAAHFSADSNDGGWEREYPDDDDITTEKADEITGSLNEFLTFVNSSDDATFAAEIEQRTNVPMLIDYMIFVNFANATDNLGKNQMLVSYDGGASWVLQLRDLDTTWSLHWAGTELYNNSRDMSVYINANKLMARVYALYSDYYHARFAELRQGALSNEAICNVYREFMDSVGTGNYQLDQSIWPGVPSIELTNFHQIQQAVIERGAYLGFFLNEDITIDDIANYNVVSIPALMFKRKNDIAADVLYAVQPAEGNAVYFLGRRAVNKVYENGEVIYSRNYFPGSSATATSVEFSGWHAPTVSGDTAITVTNALHTRRNSIAGEVISFCSYISVDSDSEVNMRACILASSSTLQNGSAVTVGNEGYSTGTHTRSDSDVSSIRMTLVTGANGTSLKKGSVKQHKLVLGTVEEAKMWTIAPEDVVG